MMPNNPPAKPTVPPASSSCLPGDGALLMMPGATLAAAARVRALGGPAPLVRIEVAPLDANSLHPFACTQRPSDGPPSITPDREPPTLPSRKFGTRFRVAAALAVSSLLALGLFVGVKHRAKEPVAHFGAPAMKSSNDGNFVRWHTKQIVLTLDPSLDALGPDAKDAVRNAMGTWLTSGAKLPGVAFETAAAAGSVASDGVNRVVAAPITEPGHENDLAISKTYSDPDTGAIVEIDTIINTAHRYSTTAAEDDRDEKSEGEKASKNQCDGSFDVQNVATHEFGHFFGLGEDRTVKLATMYVESGRCETHKRKLLSSDTEGMQALYAQADEDQAPGVACSVATAGSSSTGSAAGWGAGFLSAVAVFWMRRRRA